MQNGSTAATEYHYDHNGNLTKDLNKNISNIQYNSLNLPSVVTFGNGNTITYLYTADGRKLRTVHVIGGTATTTDYCGNVIYENGTARLLLTEAGYVDLTDNGHHFYIKDHLGNNRVVADANGTVEESNQYYPFGLNYANAGSNLQPYKYNGKELDSKNGLNWYDYGARHYDAALGRWHVVDPLAEKYYSTSPYAYCLNNPVKYVDPTGMLASPIYDENGNFLGTDDEGLQGSAIVMDKSKFKQGMSHEEAQKYNLGYDGLVDENAKVNLLQNFNSLPDRPDYDGFVTIDEGIAWAKAHPNALNNPTSENSLYINTAFMDFGELSVNDIGIRNLGKNYKTNLYTLNNTLKSITDEKLRASVYALGRINIILHNPITGAVSVVNDDATDYDWNKGGGIMRSIAIQLERWRTGLNDSHGFRAIYYGRGYLNK